MVDAAGAIYVLGGVGGKDPNYIYFNDVCVSTDGGARAGLAPGGGRGGALGGYYRGTKGVLRVLKGTAEVLQGYCRGTAGVLQGVLQGYCRGYSGGTPGVLRGS